MITISIPPEQLKIIDELGRTMPRRVARSISRAINEALVHGRDQYARVIANVLTIPISELKGVKTRNKDTGKLKTKRGHEGIFDMIRSRPETLSGALRIKYGPQWMARYDVKHNVMMAGGQGVLRKRQKASGWRVTVGRKVSKQSSLLKAKWLKTGQWTTFKHFFIARMKSGHIGVFGRGDRRKPNKSGRGKGRQIILERFGPPPVTVVEELNAYNKSAREAARASMEAYFAKRIGSNLAHELKLSQTGGGE